MFLGLDALFSVAAIGFALVPYAVVMFVAAMTRATSVAFYMVVRPNSEPGPAIR